MEMNGRRREDEMLFLQALRANADFHAGRGNYEYFLQVLNLLEDGIQNFTSVSARNTDYLERDVLGCCQYLTVLPSKQQIYLRSLSAMKKKSPMYNLLQLYYYHEVSHALSNLLSRHKVNDTLWISLREFAPAASYGESLNEVANDYFMFLIGAHYTNLLSSHSLDFILTHSSSEWGMSVPCASFFMTDLCRPFLWIFCNQPDVSYDSLIHDGKSPILSTTLMKDGKSYPINEFFYAARMNADSFVRSINVFLDDNHGYEKVANLIDDIRKSYVAGDPVIYSQVDQFRDICDQLFFFRELSLHDRFNDEKLLKQYNNRYDNSWLCFYRNYPDYLENHPKILKR